MGGKSSKSAKQRFSSIAGDTAAGSERSPDVTRPQDRANCKQDTGVATSARNEPFHGEQPPKNTAKQNVENDKTPKEFIGQITSDEKVPKQFIGQMKLQDHSSNVASDQAELKDENPTTCIGQIEVEVEGNKKAIKSTEHLKYQIEFDDKDIDEESRLFLNEMLLSNVETCDLEDSENDDKSCSDGTDEESSDDKQQRFQPNFAEFPSHCTLRRENRRYLKWKRTFPNEKPLYDGYPHPDGKLKDDIFKKVQFVSIDKHALETPAEYLNKTMKELVTYLIRVCHSDLEKARVLFRWCCGQDLSNLTGKGLLDSMKEKLISIKAGKECYSEMYGSMCRFAGLQCVFIEGTVKGAGYTVGQNIVAKSSYGNWVAVKIDGLWRLVDVHFASRHQTGGGSGEWELIDDNGNGYRAVDDAPVGLTYLLDEFYFLTDPEEFIYNHLPDDEQWQLLARPVTKHEFQNMAHLRGPFFTMGMNVLQAKRGTVHAPSGDTVIKLGLPKAGCRQFMYRLWKSSKDGNLDFDFKGNKLTQFVYMEQMDRKVLCKILYPTTGKYKFQLYVKDCSSKDSSYSLSAEYILLCTQKKELCPVLPTNNRQEWGPGQNLLELGMTPVNCKYGTIESDDGEVKLVYKYDPARPVDVLVKVSSQSGKNDEFKNWVLYSTENEMVTINLRLQEEGHYALDIYAKPQKVKGKFSLVCTYLVVSTSGVFNQLKFPDVANQSVGSVGGQSEWNITTVSHKEPYFTSKQGFEAIVFQYDAPLEFSANLYLQKGNTKNIIENYTFLQQKKNNITFNVRFPKSGMYNLSIYAKLKTLSGSLPCIYQYVVFVPLQLKNCKPFPKFYSIWGIGCELHCPLDGQLPEQQLVDVSVVIPNAQDVAIIKAGGSWTHLTKNATQQWTGNIDTGVAGEGLKLSATFSKGGTSFSTLGEYEVLSRQELEDQEKIQEKEYAMGIEEVCKEEADKKDKENVFKEIEKELSEDTKRQNLSHLYNTVGRVERRSYTTKLKQKYNTMRNSIKSMERTKRLENAIMDLDASSITDVQERGTHSKLLADIVKATQMLLKEQHDFDQASEGREESGEVLKKDIENFCLEEVPPELATRSMKILKPIKFDDVKEESAAAARLYAWCLGVAEEMKVMKNTTVKKRKSIPFQQE